MSVEQLVADKQPDTEAQAIAAREAHYLQRALGVAKTIFALERSPSDMGFTTLVSNRREELVSTPWLELDSGAELVVTRYTDFKEGGLVFSRKLRPEELKPAYHMIVGINDLTYPLAFFSDGADPQRIHIPQSGRITGDNVQPFIEGHHQQVVAELQGMATALGVDVVDS